MCVGYHVADFDVAAAPVQAGVQDPWALGEGVWDRGNHADAAGVPDGADVCGDDVENKGAFEESLAGPWMWC